MNYWSHYSLPVRHSLTPELYSMLRSLRSYLEQNCQEKRFLDTSQEQDRDHPRVIREFRYKIIQQLTVVCNLSFFFFFFPQNNRSMVANVSPVFRNDCEHLWELQISKSPLKTSQICRNNHYQNSQTLK